MSEYLNILVIMSEYLNILVIMYLRDYFKRKLINRVLFNSNSKIYRFRLRKKY